MAIVNYGNMELHCYSDFLKLFNLSKCRKVANYESNDCD